MPLRQEEIQRIALLARLQIEPDETPVYQQNLTRILDFVRQLENADTQDVVPMAHPLDQEQRLRDDVVTETNQRELYQQSAPETHDGLYIVPKVIE